MNLTSLPHPLLQAFAAAQLNQLAALQTPLAAEIHLAHDAECTTALNAAAALLAAKPDPRAWSAREHYVVIKALLAHAPLQLAKPTHASLLESPVEHSDGLTVTEMFPVRRPAFGNSETDDIPF